MTPALTLSAIQVRILGSLVEKQHTTPDQYPLTLNALKNACNQKTSRAPIVNYYEGELGAALNELEAGKLVARAWSARVPKYEQRLARALDIQTPVLAVLCVLMLRGPQTVAELRSHTQRIHVFDDADDVEYVLQRMQDREPPLVLLVPRQPGQKEERFAHLFAGIPDPQTMIKAAQAASSPLEQRVTELEQAVQLLQEKIARM